MRARLYAVPEEQRLDSNIHDCTAFDCGIPALNDYLVKFATQHRRRGVSQTYVLVNSSDPAVVLGYYTLSAAQIDVVQILEADRKRLPRYPIACIRMGRLACRIDQQGKGLGQLLIGCAVDRCLKAREEIAAYALVVDAKDGRAKSFYEYYGFTACVDRPLTLYLPLGR
jgi:predicted GNAT family N-acyltransferase